MPPARREPGRTRAEVGPRRRRPTPARAVVLAVGFDLALVVVDVVTGSSIVFATAYVLPPLALATVAGPRQVLPVAVLALALSIASGAWNGFLFSTDHVVRVLLVTLAGTLAVLSARAREEEARARRRADAARREAVAAHASRPRPGGPAPTIAPRRSRPACCPTACPRRRAGSSRRCTARALRRPRSAATSTTSSRSTAA